MNNKRFTWNNEELVIEDKVKKDQYEVVDITRIDSLIDLLNDMNDDYHSMQELYDFRMIYNCLLFNQWYENSVFEVYKSKKHHDDEICFDGDFFIVVANLPSGQITNHYLIKYWDYFKIPEYERMKDEFDGHTSQDVLKRLKEVI